MSGIEIEPHPPFKLEIEDKALEKALARIEALEAALRAIADQDNCLMISEMEEIARAALEPENDL